MESSWPIVLLSGDGGSDLCARPAIIHAHILPANIPAIRVGAARCILKESIHTWQQFRTLPVAKLIAARTATA